MKNLILLATSFLLAAQVSNASMVSEKLVALTNKVEAGLTPYVSGASDVDALANGDVRQFLFSMQTLADLFSAHYAELGNVRVVSKRFEDQIGAYRKSGEQLDYARRVGVAPEKIKELENRNRLEKEALVSFIEQNGWKDLSRGTISSLRETLQAIAWTTDEAERRFAFGGLASLVGRIAAMDWKMDHLEGGDGIHDLRKQVRWYKLQSAGLGEIFGVRTGSCKAGALTPMDPASGGRCLVSECLSQRMNEIYEVFGAIKDAGEGQEGIGGHIPEDLLRDARALYEKTRLENTFETLTTEIRSCAQ